MEVKKNGLMKICLKAVVGIRDKNKTQKKWQSLKNEKKKLDSIFDIYIKKGTSLMAYLTFFKLFVTSH